jgi:hypothetical protein
MSYRYLARKELIHIEKKFMQYTDECRKRETSRRKKALIFLSIFQRRLVTGSVRSRHFHIEFKYSILMIYYISYSINVFLIYLIVYNNNKRSILSSKKLVIYFTTSNHLKFPGSKQNSYRISFHITSSLIFVDL